MKINDWFEIPEIDMKNKDKCLSCPLPECVDCIRNLSCKARRAQEIATIPKITAVSALGAYMRDTYKQTV